MWLRIGTSGELLWMRWWTFGLRKMWGMSWLAEELSQEGLWENPATVPLCLRRVSHRLTWDRTQDITDAMARPRRGYSYNVCRMLPDRPIICRSSILVHAITTLRNGWPKNRFSIICWDKKFFSLQDVPTSYGYDGFPPVFPDGEGAVV